jgi:hypothetical protein
MSEIGTHCSQDGWPAHELRQSSCYLACPRRPRNVRLEQLARGGPRHIPNHLQISCASTLCAIVWVFSFLQLCCRPLRRPLCLVNSLALLTHVAGRTLSIGRWHANHAVHSVSGPIARVRVVVCCFGSASPAGRFKLLDRVPRVLVLVATYSGAGALLRVPPLVSS